MRLPLAFPAAHIALLALALCGGAQSAEPRLVMIAPTDQGMPIARFQNGQLSGGILMDLGDALAQRLGRQASYLSVDVPGVKATLTSGRADGMCYVVPFWIDGDYNWSTPLFADAEMVVSVEGAPHIHSIKDLRGKPVGTVTGYRYPRVEQVLGLRFVRSDSDTMEKNLRQMMSGKV